jgi:ribosome modulation factor
MKTNTERLKARMEGAKAALEGKKMDANTYPETDDLHFEWLAAWTDVQMDRMKSRGPNSQDR